MICNLNTKILHLDLLSDCFLDNIPSLGLWRLNFRLLAGEFIDFLSNQIDSVLETNGMPCMTKWNLWEMMEALLSGQIISYSAGKMEKKNNRSGQSDYLKDKQHRLRAFCPTANVRGVLQSELDTLTPEAEEVLYLRSWQQNTEYGEKASNWRTEASRNSDNTWNNHRSVEH